MKKNIRGMIVSLLLFVCLLTGCKVGDTNIVIARPLSSKYVFQIGNMKCSVKEAKLYLTNFQNLYAQAYTLNLWEHDFGDESLESYIKTITMNELVSMISMNQLAAEKEITLSEEDLRNLQEAAKAYYQSLSQEERAYLGVTEKDLLTFYEHYGLARKVYYVLTDEINGEVSDDEARVMEVMQIFVSEENKAMEVSEKLKNGEDFASVANLYNELANIQCYVAREDLPKHAEEIAFQMNNGEVSELIAVEDGYYFFKCINKYNEALTEENKQNIVIMREKEAFYDVYYEFVEGLDSFLNEDVWENMRLDTSSTIKTDSFISTYETYCR